MVDSGDYVRIRLGEVERNKKPAGIHWAQAATVHALEAVGIPARPGCRDQHRRYPPLTIPQPPGLQAAFTTQLLESLGIRPNETHPAPPLPG